MWITTTAGFLSVAQNLDSTGPGDAILVRGRVRADLEHFADFVAHDGGRPAVTETPLSDYGYRLTTSREMFASYLLRLRELMTRISSLEGADLCA